ncbi:MAG TPA: HAD family phosphatase [Candidatus Saccharimonadales bacterium]|nr:HAD family phosphatase [Candidatus Saccharimonadales bacterium]
MRNDSIGTLFASLIEPRAALLYSETMITTIIFDFFDVIRTDPAKALFKQYGIERTGKYSQLFHRLDLGEIEQNEFFTSLSKLSGVDEIKIIEHYADTYVANDNLLILIEDLKKNYKIGLLSNSPRTYLRDILKKHDLEKLFDEVVISSEINLLKPSPEAFNYTLKKLNSSPAETIFIDDTVQNVEAAQKLGIGGIHFKSVTQLKTELVNQGVYVN